MTEPTMPDVIKVKLAAIVAIGTITLETAHNLVGFLTACCALGYAATKWYMLIRGKKTTVAPFPSKEETKQ